MPRRNLVFAVNEAYHVYNRSVANEDIFTFKRSLNKATDLLDYYRFPQTTRYSQFQLLSQNAKIAYLSNLKKQKPLVEIFSFSFMPNHFHLLIKQLQEKGVYKFISNFQNSFAKYYNIKNKRVGSLFQNPFKAKRVASDEEFIHISRYIHLNPVTSYLIKLQDLPLSPYTSLFCYFSNKENKFVQTDWIIENFKTKERYLKFIFDQADYQKELAQIKSLILE